MNDAMLLKQYAGENSQEAFSELVCRHAGWVYSASLRMVRDRQLAEDVCQAVFLVLARKAGQVKGDSLGTWLFGVTRYSCIHALRAKNRRERHEREYAEMMGEASSSNSENSWEQIGPLLDEAVGRLSSADRHVILLRFYEQKSLYEVGRSLGISDDAARKRVAKAVGKLRRMLTRHGVTSTVSGLDALLVAKTAPPAPVKLIQACQGVASESTANISSISKGALKMMLIRRFILAATILLAITFVLMGSRVVSWARPARDGRVRSVAEATAAEPQATSPERDADELDREHECASHLREIGQGVLLWASENKGKFPPDFASLIRNEDISSAMFVCPDTGHKVPANLSRAEQADWVNAHSDYVYVGAGLNSNLKWRPNGIDRDTLIAYEKKDNHPGIGMNLLYGDGHVQFEFTSYAEKSIELNARERGWSAATSQP